MTDAEIDAPLHAATAKARAAWWSWKCRRPHMREDFEQEARINLWRNQRKWRGDCPYESWRKAIADQGILMTVQRMRRLKRGGDDAILPRNIRPEDALIFPEYDTVITLNRIIKAANSLPAIQRTAIADQLAGRGFEEVARTRGICATSARTRWLRAVAALRTRYYA